MSKQTKTEHVQRIARERAYYNKDGGGVLITARAGAKNQNGVHWSVMIDDGNYSDGRPRWIAGRASGGGYDVRAAAMAEAVRGIAGIEIAEAGVDIGWHNQSVWADALAKAGWRCMSWGDGIMALIPSERIAERIHAEVRA